MEVARTSMIHAAAPHFLWPFALYNPATRRVLSSKDVTFDESVCYYRLLPHVSSPVPPPPLFLFPCYPPVDPHPPSCPAPPGVSHITPPPLVGPLEVSFGLAEGDDLVSDDTAVSHRSSCLETPPGFQPRLSSPPLQLVAVDSGDVGGGGTGGAGCEGADVGVAQDPTL
ncbi:unnamed protein product [Closterium sp. NIES-54]